MLLLSTSSSSSSSVKYFKKNRYFRAYLANEDGTRKGEDVDISVHCDVNIFEWLVIICWSIDALMHCCNTYTHNNQMLNNYNLFYHLFFSYVLLSFIIIIIIIITIIIKVGFMQTPNTPPVLDTSSVVSILISAEFLEMEKLVNHCLNFMSGHLDEVAPPSSFSYIEFHIE
jgi:hypothetical protein